MANVVLVWFWCAVCVWVWLFDGGGLLVNFWCGWVSMLVGFGLLGY